MPPPFFQTPSSLDSFLTNLIFSVKLEMIPVCAFCVQMLQSCSTLCDPMDHSSLGSSVHGVLQARILKWVAMPSSLASPASPALLADSLPLSQQGSPEMIPKYL